MQSVLLKHFRKKKKKFDIFQTCSAAVVSGKLKTIKEISGYVACNSNNNEKHLEGGDLHQVIIKKLKKNPD